MNFRTSFSRVGHQNKCQRKVMVWLASGKLGGVSPQQHLGMDRVWDKQAISRARSWVWMLLLSLVHCLLPLPVEHPTTCSPGRMQLGLTDHGPMKAGTRGRQACSS